MPGNIRVAVLEAIDLPATITAGKSVAVKVAVGRREFQTSPVEPQDGRTRPWNSEFLFPVLNLRDNLVVAMMDSKGDIVARAELETPGIVQKGFQDAFVALKAGGRLHMEVSFVLSEEERKKIEAMRQAAMKKRKAYGNEPYHRSRRPVSSVRITEIIPEECESAQDSNSKVATQEHKSEEAVESPCNKTEEVLSTDSKRKNSSCLTDNRTKSRPRLEKEDDKTHERATVRETVEKRMETAETSRWLEDLDFKAKPEKFRSAKAARANEWIKQLDKRDIPQQKHTISERERRNIPENVVKKESSKLKIHLQEEAQREKSLREETASNLKRSNKTVKQKLEEWKVKEFGPWSSKVRHASDNSPIKRTGWLLKKSKSGRHEQTLAAEEIQAPNVNPEQLTDDKVSSPDFTQEQAATESHKKSSAGVKGLVKQVMSGAAVVAGAFTLWPRKGSSKKK